MKNNSQKLYRYLSEPCHGNVIKSTNKIIMPITKKNFFRQISKEAEQKIDQSERGAQLVSKILQQQIFTRLTSINLQDQHTNIIVESISPHVTIETGIKHCEKQIGSQRLRWNLLFNLLLWIVIPLPLWIPFVSNRLAIYLLPSIQGVFVSMWISKKT